jgi:hypothetical protein
MLWFEKWFRFASCGAYGLNVTRDFSKGCRTGQRCWWVLVRVLGWIQIKFRVKIRVTVQVMF